MLLGGRVVDMNITPDLIVFFAFGLITEKERGRERNRSAYECHASLVCMMCIWFRPPSV